MIISQNLRSELGATPAYTVSAVITSDLKRDQNSSIFARTAPGEYILRKYLNLPETENLNANSQSGTELENQPIGLINAFGMYWRRELVNWNNNGAPAKSNKINI